MTTRAPAVPKRQIERSFNQHSINIISRQKYQMSSRQWNWFFVDRIINRCGDCGRQPASEEEDDKSWRCWGKILYFNSKNMVIIWKIFPKPCIKLHGKKLKKEKWEDIWQLEGTEEPEGFSMKTKLCTNINHGKPFWNSHHKHWWQNTKIPWDLCEYVLLVE